MRMVEGSDVLKSKEENFSGYFQVSEDELRELLREFEDDVKAWNSTGRFAEEVRRCR